MHAWIFAARYPNQTFHPRNWLTQTLNYVVFLGDGADIPAYVEPVVTAGHEFSGRVVALGEGAEEVSHHFEILC
jgi:hypothetical protein